ncbi:MAG: hypothetical protein IJX54_05680 [Oscillospiraceae bacterium]|nr:hypothetical protein [Oscillospiraceae bacterium]
MKEKLTYFKNYGVDIMPFDDFYPSGHRLCVTIIMHGNRVATCGDIRFEQTPGKWKPIPKQIDKKIDPAEPTLQITPRQIA